MDYINFLDVNIKCLKNAKENIIDGTIQSYVSIVRELMKYNLRNRNFPIQEIQNQIREVYKSDNVFLINELQSKIRDLNLDNDYIISNLTHNEDYKNFFKHLISLLNWINGNDNKTKQFSQNQNIETDKHKKKENDFIWFKVGLHFATGEIDSLILEHNSNATKISKVIFGEKWGSFRPYISESITRNNKNDKNIFNSQSKIKEIQKYCKENNITMIDSVSVLFQSN
jgi:hypothetical protein